MIRPLEFPWPLLLLVAALACDRAPDSGAEAPAGGELIPLNTPDTVVVLGDESLGDGHEFGDVVDAVLLAEGEIAVADQMANEIRVFSADGSLVRRLGGPGEGPGEFHRLQAVAPYGADSLVAHDLAPQSVVVIHREGSTVRPIQLRIPFERVNSTRFLGPAEDSLLVFEVSFVDDPRMPTDGLAAFSKAVALFALNGDFRAEVVRLRGRQMLRGRCMIQGRATNCTSDFPFNTAEVPILIGNHLAVLDPVEATVRLLPFDGSAATSWSPGRPADSLDAASSRAIWEDQLQDRPAEVRDGLLEIASSIPLFEPQWTGFLRTGPSGLLLVRREESELEAVGFSETGTPIFRILLGAAAEVLDVSADRILVLNRDEFDVERVVVLHLAATSG